MAQVPTKEGVFKAWTPSSNVKPELADCVVPLKYDGNRTIPKPDGLVALRGLAASTCLGPGKVVHIVALVPEAQSDSELDLLRAADRSQFVRSNFLERAVDPARIQTTFVRTKDAGSAAPVTVEVFSR
jgi:hypothetical protein